MFIEEVTNIQVVDNIEHETKGYDFSTLNAISTCPFYGITRFIHNKVFDDSARNMALECGDLCHKCFAAYRALSVYYRGKKENKETLMHIGFKYLVDLFNEVVEGDIDTADIDMQVECMLQEAENKAGMLAKYLLFSDWIIDNSGYYEDPEDKKRTIPNIKDSLMAYCSNFLNIIEDEPVWIADETDTDTKIGIEIPFDVTVKITYIANGAEHTQDVHFIGKLDGIHVRKIDNTLIVHENKTASRLDDAWSGQWFKSHQITGYCLAASYFTGQNCLQARVLGMQIPVPKYSGYAFRTERVDRDTFYFSDWARWILSTIEIVEEYKDHPEKAPMNTHACCKYYKQCAFVPLCCVNEEERINIMEKEMITQEWSPLDE